MNTTKTINNQSCQFDEDYYLRGVQSGKSLYENYRYLPELSKPMVKRIAEVLGITLRSPNTVTNGSLAYRESFLDFGCARGYIVRAAMEQGINAFGVDISEWAIANADPMVKERVWRMTKPPAPFDFILAKDVLEHIEEVDGVIHHLQCYTLNSLLAIVPLSAVDGEPYIIPEMEKDVTHVQRLTIETWGAKFARRGWNVETFTSMEGIKDNWQEKYPTGNGFILARRIR